jgi:transposase
MGLDHHKTFCRITARDRDGNIVRRQRIDYDLDRAKLRRQLGAYPPQTPVVLEATFAWGWISDELAAAGLCPHLANSSKVAVWRKTRGGAKSNRVDADVLSELWSDKSAWWRVWLAPPEVRDLRQWLRHRMALVQTQTAVKNRVHALLHRQGLIADASDLFGTNGRRWLSLLLKDHDSPLPQGGREILKALLCELDTIRSLIAAANRQFSKTLRVDRAAKRLMTLPGVGRATAYTLIAEIGDINRFKSAAKLAAYSLLAPLAHDSGEEDPDASPIGRRLGHAGRRTLKWALIEAARGAVKKDPRMKAIFDRRTAGGTRDRNRGYITVAHRMCELVYVLWKKDQTYDPSGRIRPGSQPRDVSVADAKTAHEQRVTRKGRGAREQIVDQGSASGQPATGLTPANAKRDRRSKK